MESPSEPDYMTYFPIEEVEKLHHYRPGGYHPVTLGDKLSQGRYTILNKLGYGGYSTVWMARDEQAQDFVAVKIHVAAVDTTVEREILQLLAGAVHDSSSQYVLQFLDVFAISGPNGSHDCLVSEPCGYNLMLCKENCESAGIFRLEVARAIAAQMILATAFIHSHGIVHGDLHLGNFMLRIPFDINALTVEEYLARYPCYTVPVERQDGRPVPSSVPQLAVGSTGIDQVLCNDLTLADARVVLTDFGTAWVPSKLQVFQVPTPRMFLPPETLFAERLQCPLGPAADIWTLAHSLYAIFTPDDLLRGSHRDDHDVFAKCISLLGHPPPNIWFDVWSARRQFFNAAGEWAPRRGRTRPRAGTVATRMDDLREERRSFDHDAGVVFSDEELADLKDVIQSMLQWLPEDRITAKQLVNGTWMQNWGTPALNKFCNS